MKVFIIQFVTFLLTSHSVTVSPAIR